MSDTEPSTRKATPAAAPATVHAALLAVSLLFGGNYVVAKFAFREVSPFTLVVLRTWGTAAILFAYSALRRPATRVPFTRREYGELFLYSLLGATINQVCFLEGLARSTATNAAIMLVCIPLLTLAFAVMLGRERATVTGVIGIVIGLAGALLIVLPHGNVSLSAEATTGNLLLFAGGTAYALYLVLTRPILARHDALRVVSWIFLFAGLTVLPFGFGGLGDLHASGLTGAGWASVSYVVIGATVFPYVLNSWALARVTSSVVAVYILVQPLVAGALGRVFLHEALGPYTAVAAVFTVSGVALSAWKRA